MIEHNRNIEAELERLKELENTVEHLQRRNRERVKKFVDKQKQAGMVQVSAFISKQAYAVINNRRDKKIKAGSIIEQALLFFDSIQDNININYHIGNGKTHLIKPAPAPEAVVETENKQLTNIDISNIPDKAVDKIGFKTWLFKQIEALKQAGCGYIQIAETLNEAGIKTIQDKEFNRKSIEKIYNTYQK
ncbi:hypothetical protein MCHI_001820 [Candidatus Magnetoovum chiemensis]|nr:hypothetical protein MCHI_001820 [Candidatus Magnetoovum chiemensis]